MWRHGKGLEICIVDIEFESGRVFFIRVWNSWGFTYLSRLIKYVF